MLDQELAVGKKSDSEESHEATSDPYEAIRNLVLSGVLAHGEQLVESQLAERFNVSRTPVREALARLTSEGLVEHRPNRTKYVADLWTKVEDVLAIRLRLEPWAASLASYRMAAADIDGLRAMQDRMERLLDDPENTMEELLVLNRSFHERIVSFCGNPSLIEVLDRLRPYSVFPRILERYSSDTLRIATLEHREIIEGLWQRDKNGIERLVSAHLERGNIAIQEMLQRRKSEGELG